MTAANEPATAPAGTAAAEIGRELRDLFIQGPHTKEIWNHVDEILTATENLTYLGELAAGNLDPEAFTNYLLQDEIYLDSYAKAMSLLAAKAPVNTDSRFWANSAGTAVTVENEMHEALLASPEFASLVPGLLKDGLPVPSPTTLGYASFLVATAATRPYEVGVAGVLPCFWVYAHIGKVLTRLVGDQLASHPYREWIEAYDSEEFDASTRGAAEILERELAAARPAERAEMFRVFEQACMYELHFWASAREIQRFELVS